MNESEHPQASPQSGRTAEADRRVAGMSCRRLSVAVVLVVVGSVLLLERQGLISRHTMHQWWPLGLIAAGLWIAALSWRR